MISMTFGIFGFLDFYNWGFFSLFSVTLGPKNKKTVLVGAAGEVATESHNSKTHSEKKLSRMDFELFFGGIFSPTTRFSKKVDFRFSPISTHR